VGVWAFAMSTSPCLITVHRWRRSLEVDDSEGGDASTPPGDGRQAGAAKRSATAKRASAGRRTAHGRKDGVHLRPAEQTTDSSGEQAAATGDRAQPAAQAGADAARTRDRGPRRRSGRSGGGSPRRRGNAGDHRRMGAHRPRRSLPWRGAPRAAVMATRSTSLRRPGSARPRGGAAPGAGRARRWRWALSGTPRGRPRGAGP
jgi:hypothetical protein